jgi:hypothetical protein
MFRTKNIDVPLIVYFANDESRFITVNPEKPNEGIMLPPGTSIAQINQPDGSKVFINLYESKEYLNVKYDIVIAQTTITLGATLRLVGNQCLIINQSVSYNQATLGPIACQLYAGHPFF